MKKWYRIAVKSDREDFYTMTADNEHEEHIEEQCPNFVCWLTDRIEYELPEGDA